MLAEILGHVSSNPATHPSEQVHPWLSPPRIRDFQDSRMCTHLVPLWIWTGTEFALLLGRALAIGNRPIPCTTPASSAEHALLEPSCRTTRLKPSGNCSDESSHPKGSVTHPLPSSGHSLPCLCSLEQLCSPLPVSEHPAKLLALAKPT